MGFKILLVVFGICLSQVDSVIFPEWERTNDVQRSDPRDPPLKYETKCLEGNACVRLDDQIKFWYYPGHWDDDFAELLHLNNSKSLLSSSLRKGLPYKFLIHGFLENGKSRFSTVLSKAYRTQMDKVRSGQVRDPDFKEMNIISVGWGALSGNQRDRDVQEYNKTVSKLPCVSRHTAEFICFLKREGYLELEDVHIIGHSLGAHVAGMTGHYIQRLCGGGQKLARITGLDPAGPLINDRIHLKKENAVFVDIIHSDANTTFIALTTEIDVGIAFGTDKQCGHVDFYPNGGERPFLMAPSNPCFFSGPIKGLDHVCLHNCAYHYFAASIVNPRGSMIGYQCHSYTAYQTPWGSWFCKSPNAIFGEYVNQNKDITKPGKYYLDIPYSNLPKF